MNQALEIQMAQEALGKVEQLAEQLGAAEGLLEKGYAQFAEALLVVQENRYWMGDHASWGDYLKYIMSKYNMGRSQLSNKIRAVRELRGVVESADLSTMGITKAGVLADAYSVAKTLPEGIVELAKDPTSTAKDLRAQLQVALRLPEDEGKEWFDMGFAFMVTPEERAELLEAEEVARGTDPVTNTSAKESVQKLDIALKLSREYLATYQLPREEEESV